MEKKRKFIVLSNILIVVGVGLIILFVILMFSSIIAFKKEREMKNAEFDQAMMEYEAAYDEWHDAWWNDRTATLEDMPTMPKKDGFSGFSSGETLVYIPGIMFGVSVLVAGIVIRFVKATPKHNKEMLEELVANTENQGDVVDDQKDGRPKVCPCCGGSLDSSSKTCPYCGREQG